MPNVEKWVCRYCHKEETGDTAGCRCGLPWPLSCNCEECTRRGSSWGKGLGATGTLAYQTMREDRFPFRIELQRVEEPKSFWQAAHDMQVAYGERDPDDRSDPIGALPSSGHDHRTLLTRFLDWLVMLP